jgi:hypothetical protein
MQCPRAVIFDLDDTLADSFQPPSALMIERLRTLLARLPIAIMTAAGFPRVERQFLTELADSPHINNLFVFPNSTAECFLFEDGAWKCAYSLALTAEERAAIANAIRESELEIGIDGNNPKYVPEIIVRDAQVAYAVLGLKATEEDKVAWDPDQKKRMQFKAALEKRIPNFEILIGGRTTIDITRKGINKSHGVRWLAERLGVAASDMLYVGDALYPGGNDEVVAATGIQTHTVNGPDDTIKVIDELLFTCTI